MKQIQLNFWNEFKRVFCYETGIRYIFEKNSNPWKVYDRLVDIKPDFIKNQAEKNGIKMLIIDMDGTLKHYKRGLVNENKEWINKVKKYVDIYIISNANEELTSKVANELKVKYVCKAKKPSSFGFNKILDECNLNPNEVIMIGDSIRADIYGANRIGIKKTILLKDLNLLGLNHGVDEYENTYKNNFIFIIFSFVGWIIEMLYHIAKGIYVNRGFLVGPFCIMYGFGTLIMLKLYQKIKIKNKFFNAIVYWISIFICCSIFEYLTSYIIELLFGIRLWDYSGLSFNINGRVRLITSIAWANCGLVLIYFINPISDKLYKYLFEKNSEKLHLIIHIFIWYMIIDWIFSIILRSVL